MLKSTGLRNVRKLGLVRQAKTRGNFYVPGEAKLAFVIRIKG
jgi:large subunit ribosomal protein L7e